MNRAALLLLVACGSEPISAQILPLHRDAGAEADAASPPERPDAADPGPDAQPDPEGPDAAAVGPDAGLPDGGATCGVGEHAPCCVDEPRCDEGRVCEQPPGGIPARCEHLGGLGNVCGDMSACDQVPGKRKIVCDSSTYRCADCGYQGGPPCA